MDLIRHNQIELAIAIKASQLRRCELKSITEDHVRETLLGTVWKRKYPDNISKAIDDILKISIGDIVGYLSSKAIIDGSLMDVSEIEGLLGEHS